MAAAVLAGNSASASELNGPVLEMRKETSTAASTIRLDQILAISDADRGLSAKIGSLRLALGSAPGQSERVTRDDVAALLAVRVPGSWTMSWKGSEYCLVHVSGKPVDMQQLTMRAQALLEDWLRGRFTAYKVEPVAGSEQAPLQVGADDAVSIRPFSGPVLARTVMWVDVERQDHRGRSSVPIWFAVEASKSVPVAAADIATGARLLPEQVKTANADIAELGARPLLAEDELQGSIAIGPIRQGQALTRDLFRRAPPVVAGDDVRMILQAGRVHLETHGIALESGQAGQKVRVRNSVSGEVLVAYVSGRSQVEVLP